jgi:hypothetical protein
MTEILLLAQRSEPGGDLTSSNQEKNHSVGELTLRPWKPTEALEGNPSMVALFFVNPSLLSHGCGCVPGKKKKARAKTR